MFGFPRPTMEAVRDQLALTFQAPYETPITIAINGALMSSAWFFLPTGLRDKVFTLHGSLAFASDPGGVDVLGRALDEHPGAGRRHEQSPRWRIRR